MLGVESKHWKRHPHKYAIFHIIKIYFVSIVKRFIYEMDTVISIGTSLEIGEGKGIGVGVAGKNILTDKQICHQIAV